MPFLKFLNKFQPILRRLHLIKEEDSLVPIITSQSKKLPTEEPTAMVNWNS